MIAWPDPAFIKAAEIEALNRHVYEPIAIQVFVWGTFTWGSLPHFGGMGGVGALSITPVIPSFGA